MRVKIHDPAVRQNVQFLVDSLPKDQKVEQLAHAVIKASLDRKTGQFLSDGKGKSLDVCKPIFISYHYDAQKGEITLDVDEGKEVFDLDMDLEARQVLIETWKVMNTLCQKLKGPSGIVVKMQVLKNLIVGSDFPEKDRPLILCTWHPVDRLKAEDLLIDKPIGTFFFRKDDFTQILETQLQAEREGDVKCFTLTFKGDEDKISDVVLVHFNGKWQIYDDDPSLQGTGAKELREIIDAHAFQFKFPLYSTSGG